MATGHRWIVYTSCPQRQIADVPSDRELPCLGTNPLLLSLKLTSHSCVQMFFPSGTDVYLVIVQHVLLVSDSDPSLLATDRSCEDWKALGAQQVGSLDKHTVTFKF